MDLSRLAGLIWSTYVTAQIIVSAMPTGFHRSIKQFYFERTHIDRKRHSIYVLPKIDGALCRPCNTFQAKTATIKKILCILVNFLLQHVLSLFPQVAIYKDLATASISAICCRTDALAVPPMEDLRSTLTV